MLAKISPLPVACGSLSVRQAEWPIGSMPVASEVSTGCVAAVGRFAYPVFPALVVCPEPDATRGRAGVLNLVEFPREESGVRVPEPSRRIRRTDRDLYEVLVSLASEHGGEGLPFSSPVPDNVLPLVRSVARSVVFDIMPVRWRRRIVSPDVDDRTFLERWFVPYGVCVDRQVHGVIGLRLIRRDASRVLMEVGSWAEEWGVDDERDDPGSLRSDDRSPGVPGIIALHGVTWILQAAIRGESDGAVCSDLSYLLGRLEAAIGPREPDQVIFDREIRRILEQGLLIGRYSHPV